MSEPVIEIKGMKNYLGNQWVHTDINLTVDKGVRMRVDYDKDRNSFVLKRGTVIEPLWTEEAWQRRQSDAE